MMAMRARLPRTGPAIQALLLVEEGEEGVVSGDGEDRGDNIEDELVDEAKVVPEAPRGRFRYTVIDGPVGTAQKKFVIGSTLSGYV